VLAFIASSAGRAVVVGTAAVLCILAGALLVDVSEIRIRGLANTLNDQVGYISVARHLVETGELRSSLIYPSVLTQLTDDKPLYMPGHYATLAVAYRLFGFGAVQSILPSMVAYVISSLGVFFAFLKVYGRNFATAGALLYVFFPPNIAFGLTAMSEMTLLAAAVSALALFVYLPPRLKVVIGPCLLVLPLLFRETAVLLIVPFALLILFGEGTLRPKRALVFAALSTLVTALVLAAEFSLSRPSLSMLEIFSLDEQSIYADAFMLQQMHPGLGDWLAAATTKLAYNAQLLKVMFTWAVSTFTRTGVWPQAGASSLELISLGLILLSIPMGIVASVFRRRDPLLVGGLAVLSILFAAIMTLYFVRYFQALRVLLLAVPFACIVWVVLLQLLDRGIHTQVRVRRFRRPLVAGFFGLAAVFGVGLTNFALATDAAERSITERDAAFTESLQHDQRFVLVSPWELGFEYVYQHYPASWSFVPTNRATLHLLNSSHPVGTIILPLASDETTLTAEDVRSEGFNLVTTADLDGKSYMVFQRLR
jgi:hypothetical protein